MELLIRERQLYFGTRKQADPYIMQLYGKIEELKNIVKNSKIEIMKIDLEKKQDFSLILIFQQQKLNGF